MTAGKGPERVASMVKALKGWQALERKAITDTAEIVERTRSPLIRMIMEIIGHDSLMHHRVQQFLIDDLERATVTVTREDIAEMWERIEEHDKAERRTIEMAKALKEEAWSPVHKQLLGYLLADESKHDSLLEQLDEVKRGMSQTSGG